MGLLQRRLPNGQPVALVDPGETALLYREVFVERCYLRDGFPAAPPEVIFDIGANIGLASMFFRRCFPDAFIVAVEPGPEAYQALRENFARHVPGGVTRNAAVAARAGRARFGYYRNAPAESGFYADSVRDTELATRLLVRTGLAERDAYRLARARHRIDYVECETVTLSGLIHETGVDRIDLLKIDVEKSEHEVLAGIDEPDWHRIGNLVLEVHDIDGRLAGVRALLRRHGYRLDTCQEHRLAGTDMHMVFATRAVAGDPAGPPSDPRDRPATSRPATHPGKAGIDEHL